MSLQDDADIADFQYDPEFARSGIEISPLVMPLSSRIYPFPALPRISFHGLPDSPPTRCPIVRQCADRRLAREPRPHLGELQRGRAFVLLDRAAWARWNLRRPSVTDCAARRSFRWMRSCSLHRIVLTDRHRLAESFAADRRRTALADILRVGTSAGGARAKAIIAWNPATNEMRSGQVKAPPGFGYWLMKFDGVTGNKDKELEDPQGYTVVEYAYSLMAKAAGVVMTECRLLDEGGRRHFMTRRYDRSSNGDKLHAQSLAALAHLDFNAAGAYSYEQAFDAIKRLKLPMSDLEQQFRRMLFNVVARNQDDHVKNIAFLMDKSGQWSLAPAFDVTYAYNPVGAWTAHRLMTINGKQDDFSLVDFRTCAWTAGSKRGRADALLDEVRAAVARWPEFARAADVPAGMRETIRAMHRLEFTGN